MNLTNKFLFVLIVLISTFSEAQPITVEGKITSNTKVVPFANVMVAGENIGASADENGYYELQLDEGSYQIRASAVGFVSTTKSLQVSSEDKSITLNFELKEDLLGLEQIVVSATRNRVNQKKTPVVVNVLDAKIFESTQSMAVCETLNYQPGVRVETNCQNCGFTQVRLNGLDGSYTQVLINSRAVFSALNSVYGLEQIPTSILDRIEVVRSGGSALFGSNAIAGTINIITKEPEYDAWELSTSMSLIDGKVPDRNLNMNASVISEDFNSGITVFGMKRDREEYDANGDGFTELTELTNTGIGAKAFLKPKENTKLTLDLTALEEYRRGGDRLYLAPHLTDITEELEHNTFMGGLTYEIEQENRQWALYASGQHTDRDSYYGGLGGDRIRQDSITAANAYGKTNDLALLAGVQLTNYFKSKDVLTTGAEYKLSQTEDNITGYNRFINQQVNSVGLFAQYEWKPTEKFSALLGSRLDYVKVEGDYTVQQVNRASEIDQTVLSPRLTVLYNFAEDWRLRGGYARGFRAPQAFNEDLHISSVGGEPQFVILSDDLETEYSNAYTASINYSKNFKKLQTNFLLEGFYTDLQNPFTTVSTGAVLPNGSILEEVRNGSGAYVAGANVEVGLSPSADLTFQMGGTLQQSKYKETQLLYEAEGNIAEEEDILIEEFVRNPSVYGYFTTNWQFLEESSIALTGTYTGPMTVPLVVSDTGFLNLNKSEAFYDINLKLNHHFDISDNFQLNVFGGVKNIFNSYQDDFDTGPTRDSDYVYGPAQPRTFFFGIKMGKLHN